jgi:hypothetical protein
VSKNKIKIGDHIYLAPSTLPSLGGKATVSKMTSSYGSTFVEVKELPEGHGFNLDFLLPLQDQLRQQYGEKMVRPHKDAIKEKIQAASLALEEVGSYASSLLSDLDEDDLAKGKTALKRIKKKLK